MFPSKGLFRGPAKGTFREPSKGAFRGPSKGTFRGPSKSGSACHHKGIDEFVLLHQSVGALQGGHFIKRLHFIGSYTRIPDEEGNRLSGVRLSSPQNNRGCG